MRMWVMAGVATLLAACAGTPDEPPPEPIPEPPAQTGPHALGPAELGALAEGRAGCAAAASTEVCESVFYFDDVSANALVAREVTLFPIADMIEGPMADFIRSRPAYQQYGAVFETLGAQRARGDYAYVKLVEPATQIYTPALSAWCAPQGSAPLDQARFFFSNDALAQTSGDLAFDASVVPDLRAFVRALLTDAEFRAAIEDSQDAALGFDALIGARRLCARYVGEAGAGEVQRLFLTEDGTPFEAWTDAMALHASDSGLRLNPG